MATRCTIKVEGIDFAKVYKHWDGHPNSTLKWLENFNANHKNNRGEGDSEYKLAQLLRDSIRNCSTFNLDSSQYTGWGIVPYDCNVFEEYEYTLLNNGQVIYKQV